MVRKKQAQTHDKKFGFLLLGGNKNSDKKQLRQKHKNKKTQKHTQTKHILSFTLTFA